MQEVPAIAAEIERALRSLGNEARAAGAKRYLKSELEFIGVATPPFRAAIRGVLAGRPPLDRSALLAVAGALWATEVFELKAAAVELLERHQRLLEAADLEPVEAMLRESGTWALVDWLATRVAGPLVERYPDAAAELDRWARDGNFWIRRAALLAPLLPLRRGGGDFGGFGRRAEAMLEEREFFIRKAIGWVLREVGKKRPELVADWLLPRVARASGVTVREAVKHLPAAARDELLGRYRAGRAGRGAAASAPRREAVERR